MFDKINKGQWWDFGWKLVEGCTKVSEACRNCWSLQMEDRFRKETGVKFYDDRILRPFARKKPAIYSLWNDLFHESITFGQIDKVMAVIASNKHHIFQILTKRIDRALLYYIEGANYCSICDYAHEFKGLKPPVNGFTKPGMLDNLWIGTTIESHKYLHRVEDLLKIPAKVRFLSIEPYLEQINLKKECIDLEIQAFGNANVNFFPRIDWIIIGCESGQKRRPCKIEWIESIVRQCKEADIPCFIKQMEINGKVEKDITKFPEHLRIRDLPKY